MFIKSSLNRHYLLHQKLSWFSDLCLRGVFEHVRKWITCFLVSAFVSLIRWFFCFLDHLPMMSWNSEKKAKNGVCRTDEIIVERDEALHVRLSTAKHSIHEKIQSQICPIKKRLTSFISCRQSSLAAHMLHSRKKIKKKKVFHRAKVY
jgi:hypothetical protein